MKKTLTLSTFLSFSVYLYAVAYDPNPENEPDYVYHKPKIQGNLTNFEDQKVVVLYRGINCVTDKFTPQQRRTFLDESQVNQSMFSSAAYELAGLGYNAHENHNLLHQAQLVAEEINGLNLTNPLRINGRRFSSQRYAFQQLYSNNCSGFYKQLTAPTDEYKSIFDNFEFTRNPLLSFSDHVKHPGKYGYGIKNFGESTPLTPDYDLQGRPKHSVLGKLYGIVLDEAAVEELMPLNVVKAHYVGELKLTSHFRNNILSEREIAIAGYVPEDYVVFEMPLQVPSFHHAEFPDYYVRKYGLTPTRYKNYRSIFTSPDTSEATRANKATQLMNEIIQAPRQDNGLRYKNCIDPSIPDLFERKLGRLDAQISTLSLDYTLKP